MFASLQEIPQLFLTSPFRCASVERKLVPVLCLQPPWRTQLVLHLVLMDLLVGVPPQDRLVV